MSILLTYKKHLRITAIVWAVCLVLLVAAYLVLIEPQAARNKRYDGTIAENRQVYESARKAAEEQTRIELDNEIERLRERLGDFVVDFENSADLTFFIGQIATERKVDAFKIGNKKQPVVSTRTAVDANSVNESRIEVSFVSGFNQFAAFVNNLERHRPVFFVHEFRMTRSKQDEMAYAVTLDVRALIRKPQETKAAGTISAGLYSVKK